MWADYVRSDVFGDKAMTIVVAFTVGVLVGGWHTIYSLLIALAIYLVVLIYLYPDAYLLYLLAASYYLAGWILGTSLFPCNRERVFRSRPHPWKTYPSFLKKGGFYEHAGEAPAL